MLRLILGTAGSGKTGLITREISDLIELGKKNICLLVPEQYSHEAERELAAICGDSLSLSAEVLSFSRLSVRVAQEMGSGGKTYLDGGGRLLCMSLAISQIYSKLHLYSSANRDANLQAELLKTIDELKTAGVSPERLSELAETSDGELSLKLSDLALCFETYNAILAQGHADPNDRLRRLAESICESILGVDGTFYIDGFLDFTGTELEVIKALLKIGTPITICLTCDDIHGDGEEFAPSRIAANCLLRYAKAEGATTEILRVNADNSRVATLRYFNDHIFRHTSEKVENTDSAITVFRCDSIRTECELAAATSLKFVREKGCRFSDIAIAARGFSDYAHVLEDSFRLYGVPLFTSTKASILQLPVPALISSAFDLISGGWDNEEVLAYMKSGLCGMLREDCDILENYVRLWNIKGSAWTRENAWKQHPQGFGREESESSNALLTKIDRLRRELATPLKKLAKSGKNGDTALSQVLALSDFLTEIQLAETLKQRAESLDRAGRAQLADEFTQIWAVLCRAMEQFSALLGEMPMTQKIFAELFPKMLAQYAISAIPYSPDSVSAGEIDRMRRRNIKHLILIGASDDRLPAVSPRNGLLSEEDRLFLEQSELIIAGATDSLSRELSLIYNCISLPSESLSISYHNFDADGAPSRPSFIISRAEALTDISTKTADRDTLRLSSRDSAFLLAAGARQGENGIAALAFAYFDATDEGRARLESFENRRDLNRGKLSKNSVQALYGSALRISPSRADAFFNCRFAYFLRYGLRLNEREKAGFDPPELGTYMHYVLEKCGKEISETIGFKDANPALSARLADKYTALYVQEKLGGFEEKSPRFIFLFNRLRPSVCRVVADMVRELSKSDFSPLDFELKFGKNGRLPPIKISVDDREIYLNGTADRVDGYYRDGKLYLRVMDYKTGKNSFSLSDVWYGMGMQMLLYLFSLEKEGKGLYGQDIIPSGVLYVPARDSLISASGDMSDENIEKERQKDLKRSGLLLNDESVLRAMEHGDDPEYLPIKYKNAELQNSDSLADFEQFEHLKCHVENRISEFSKRLSNGEIDAVPSYKNVAENACLYCPYKRICRFDEDADSRHYLSKIKSDEFWNKVGGEKNG